MENTTMPEIDLDKLIEIRNQVVGGKPPDLIAIADPYSVEQFIRIFSEQRERLLALLEPLDDVQMNFQPIPNEFSLSEVITHMTAVQGGTYNALLDLANMVLPHIEHVPRGPGAGAHLNLGAKEAARILREGTEELVELMRQSGRIINPQPRNYPFFGNMTPKSWMLFQIVHDYDHLRQSETIRNSAGFPIKVAADQVVQTQPAVQSEIIDKGESTAPIGERL